MPISSDSILTSTGWYAGCQRMATMSSHSPSASRRRLASHTGQYHFAGAGGGSAGLGGVAERQPALIVLPVAVARVGGNGGAVGEANDRLPTVEQLVHCAQSSASAVQWT